MDTYRHQDYDGDWLTIDAGTGRHQGKAIVSACDNRVAADPADLPVIVAKLYEACGLPSPVILERPGIDPQDAQSVAFVEVGPVSDARYLPVRIDAGASALTPADARRLAGLLAAYADAAEAMPDPAEVEELAKAIRADRATHDALPLPPAIDKLSAQAALRWMNARTAGTS